MNETLRRDMALRWFPSEPPAIFLRQLVNNLHLFQVENLDIKRNDREGRAQIVLVLAWPLPPTARPSDAAYL